MVWVATQLLMKFEIVAMLLSIMCVQKENVIREKIRSSRSFVYLFRLFTFVYILTPFHQIRFV